MLPKTLKKLGFVILSSGRVCSNLRSSGVSDVNPDILAARPLDGMSGRGGVRCNGDNWSCVGLVLLRRKAQSLLPIPHTVLVNQLVLCYPVFMMGSAKRGT